MLARMGLYVAGACMAYVAVWLSWMIGGGVDTTQGTLHVLVALVIAFVVGVPAGFAFAMAATAKA